MSSPQELEEVLPEVVATRKTGIKAVRYDKIVTLLIEAVKELSNKLNDKEEINNGSSRSTEFI